MKRAGNFVTVAALAPLALVWSHQARAQDFFAGKTISMSTHSTAGAGYDTYLRLLSRHMGKHIPGRPSFVVLNQPGAGGFTALNYAARVAPQDGTFLTIVSQGLLVVEATGGRGLHTSLGAFKWLGNLSQSNNVTVTWVTSNVRTLGDAKARDVTVVGGGKSELDGYLVDALAAVGRTQTPDSSPQAGYYYRSDHFSLAKRGVPMFYIDSGQDLVAGKLEDVRLHQRARAAEEERQVRRQLLGRVLVGGDAHQRGPQLP